MRPPTHSTGADIACFSFAGLDTWFVVSCPVNSAVGRLIGEKHLEDSLRINERGIETLRSRGSLIVSPETDEQSTYDVRYERILATGVLRSRRVLVGSSLGVPLLPARNGKFLRCRQLVVHAS